MSQRVRVSGAPGYDSFEGEVLLTMDHPDGYVASVVEGMDHFLAVINSRYITIIEES